MKRKILFIVLIIMLAVTALADSLITYLPVSSVWGASRTAYISDSGFDLGATKIGKAEGLVVSDINVEEYKMDAYFVFGTKLKTHYGLSKMAYILKNPKKFTKDELKKCKDTLVSAMKRDVGAPQSETNSVATWAMGDQTIEIGQGKFKSYTGNSDTTVAVVIKGLNISTEEGKNIDSRKASVPDSQANMRPFMFNPPYRKGNLNSFISGLYSISGLEYASGSNGDAVRGIQTMLVNLGYLNNGEIDGQFGNKTSTALSSFQSQNGITSNGKADLATQCMLVYWNAQIERKGSCFIARSGNYAVVIWPLKAFYIGTLDGNGNFSEGTYYYVNGEYYAGAFKNQLRNGKGTAHFPNGDVYIGEWVNDKMSGKGKYYFGGENSNTYYDGAMSDNMMNGKGVYWRKGKEITGTFSQNTHMGWN